MGGPALIKFDLDKEICCAVTLSASIRSNLGFLVLVDSITRPAFWSTPLFFVGVNILFLIPSSVSIAPSALDSSVLSSLEDEESPCFRFGRRPPESLPWDMSLSEFRLFSEVSALGYLGKVFLDFVFGLLLERLGVENIDFLAWDLLESRFFWCLEDFLDEDFLEWLLGFLESDLDLCFAKLFCSLWLMPGLDLLSSLSPSLLMSSPS
jgi:hypothetical protein